MEAQGTAEEEAALTLGQATFGRKGSASH